MWQLQRDTLQAEAAFAGSTYELNRNTSYTLIMAVTAVYVLWHFAATLSWPTGHLFNTWIVTAVLGLSTAVALVLLERTLLWAHLFWLMGLAAAISTAITLYQRPEIGFLYTLLPFMAVGILGWRVALVVEAALYSYSRRHFVATLTGAIKG